MSTAFTFPKDCHYCRRAGAPRLYGRLAVCHECAVAGELRFWRGEEPDGGWREVEQLRRAAEFHPGYAMTPAAIIAALARLQDRGDVEQSGSRWRWIGAPA